MLGEVCLDRADVVIDGMWPRVGKSQFPRTAYIKIEAAGGQFNLASLDGVNYFFASKQGRIQFLEKLSFHFALVTDAQ